MTPQLKQKLDLIIEQRDELERKLSLPDATKDMESYRDMSRQYAHLQQTAGVYEQYLNVEQDKSAAEELLGQPVDEESDNWARAEYDASVERLQQLSDELTVLLLPQDPDNQADVYLEIRAGTGGEEAGLFAAELLRMYVRYAEQRKWKLEVVSHREGETGGYREVVAHLSGEDVYRHMKYESGVHRVQRVPRTESQGRIHTSTCTVAVLPEREQSTEVEISREDIRVDTFRASGAGGQHVNKTDSAIRITHLPTGLSVECQQQRSQHQNRARAMALLEARLRDIEQIAQEQSRDQERRSMVGSGDRSEKIRTYNFPQGRVTDHRIGLTLHNLPALLEGDLDELFQGLQHEDQLALMERVGEN